VLSRRIERAPDGLFEGEESVLHLIERIVGPLGLRVDESSPWADARLPDGSRVHPHWLHNVEANPDATIEVGTETIPVMARVLREGPERDELFARQVAAYPQFGEYERKTKGHRTIPVIVLRARRLGPLLRRTCVTDRSPDPLGRERKIQMSHAER
jgi:hypothetical protein